LSVGALTACSGGNAGGAAAGSADDIEKALEAGGEITYWSWTPSAEAQVAAFEKKYPNVKVNYVNAGTNTEEYTKLQNAIKAGSGAPTSCRSSTTPSRSSPSRTRCSTCRRTASATSRAITPRAVGSVDFDGKIYGL
ncbi:sugar ABC transporter substrate-binding protein, partial [Microbacterium sp. SUBG005]